MRYIVRQFTIALLFGTFSINTFAQGDNSLRELLRVLGFAATNRAQIEFSCRENLQFAANPRLMSLCAKRNLIPDTVIEDAALPYLKRYITTQVALEAVSVLRLEPEKAVSRKLIIEIAAGRQYLLTKEDPQLLKRRNESKYGQALSAFAADPEQGRAVARAMFEYEPGTSKRRYD